MFRRHFSTFKKLPNKPWEVSEDGVVKFESLTKKSLDGALKVIQESFLKTESLCKAVGLLQEPGAAEELLESVHEAAKDGVSIVANDTSTNQIVGVIVNKLHVLAPNGESYYENLRKNCIHKSVKAICDFAIDVETKADICKRYNTNCKMEIMAVATLPYFKQKNIAGLLVQSTYKMGRKLYNGENVKTPIDIKEEQITNADAIPSILCALTTSNYSQKIGDKFGFDNVLEVKYDDYSFDGKTFSERIGDEHKTCRVVVKRLDSLIYSFGNTTNCN